MQKNGQSISRIRNVTIPVGLVLLALLASYALAGAATPEKPYYERKILKIQTQSKPGGGYDMCARLLTRHLPKYLPGKPTAIIDCIEGTFKLPNLFPKTKPDGLTIAAIQRPMAVSQLIEIPGVLFDIRKFRAIGSMDMGTQGIFVRADSGIRTLNDLRTAKPPLITRPAERGGSIDLSSSTPFMLELMGFSVKIPVGGTRGSSSDPLLAFERKEIDIFSVDYTTLVMSKRYWLEGKPYITFLMHNGACNPPSHPLLDPLLKGVPCWNDVATDSKVKAILKVWSNFSRAGRPFFAPPGTPDEVVEMLRRGFDKAMKDPDLLREAEKVGLEIAPMRGEEVQRLEEEIVALKETDPAATKIIRDVFGVQK